MTKIAKSLLELIGNTPLLELSKYSQNHSLRARLIAKLEYFNPAGSIKDRVALAMIEEAEKAGLLAPGMAIVESTSGNTGIGLAMAAAAKGYRAIFTMPDTMSVERRKLLTAYGAELVLTEGAKGMAGAVERAAELARERGAFVPGQFSNPANPQIHRLTTGPEIWEDTGGNVDVLVAGVGTGGTITGVGEYLRTKNPAIQLIAVEPFDSPTLSEGKSGPHKIQGIGAGFIPSILNTEIYDEIIKVKHEDAFAASREIAISDGLLVGISSGAALWAATRAAVRSENEKATIIVILPDAGERYLSTELFDG